MKQYSLSLCAVLITLCSTPAIAQSPEAGHLLVANPSLSDPNFGQTVLLLLRHESDGSLAVALNRPTWVNAAEAFPEIEALANYDEGLYFGGPIGIAQLLAVFESDEAAPDNALRLIDSIYVSPDLELLDGIDFSAATAPRVRIFAGHAEWGAGQLAQEIASGSWRVLPADAATIFAVDAALLWDSLPRIGAAATAALR